MDAPAGFHTITPRIVVEDVSGLVDFIKRAFDATGEISNGAPTQLRMGDSVLLISDAGMRQTFPAFLYVYVDDVQQTYRRAIEAGAVSMEGVWDTPYGDRRGMIKDPWGNLWQIATHKPT
jgi:uncharacterized glyoxalase superfamily protein PhnB